MKLMGAVVLLTLVGTQNAIHRHGGSIGTISPVSTGWPARYQHQATFGNRVTMLLQEYEFARRKEAAPAGVPARIHPFSQASMPLPFFHSHRILFPPYLPPYPLHPLHPLRILIDLILLISLHCCTMHLSNSFSPSTFDIPFPPFFCIRV